MAECDRRTRENGWQRRFSVGNDRIAVEACDQWLAAADQTGFLHLPVTAVAARASAHLPWHHADPFDRVLVAQAREHGLTIATRDPLIPPYGVPVLQV